MMTVLGFPQRFMDLIMDCVSTVSYSILIHGSPFGKITPMRGIHQGDPLSPYLFLLVAEGFSALLRKAEKDKGGTRRPNSKVWQIECGIEFKVGKERFFLGLRADVGVNPSILWRSFLWGRAVLEKGLRWRVGTVCFREITRKMLYLYKRSPIINISSFINFHHRPPPPSSPCSNLHRRLQAAPPLPSLNPAIPRDHISPNTGVVFAATSLLRCSLTPRRRRLRRHSYIRAQPLAPPQGIDHFCPKSSSSLPFRPGRDPPSALKSAANSPAISSSLPSLRRHFHGPVPTAQAAPNSLFPISSVPSTQPDGVAFNCPPPSRPLSRSSLQGRKIESNGN
ncbi:hypothetical protein M0R45_008630 [Rubus argutus]|uniref:Reverse transcriptase domain-containing protein n=1 Tax=Rubus argutus TaxID=59490 RepID=A0AAW1Y1V0_RUBAR